MVSPWVSVHGYQLTVFLMNDATLEAFLYIYFNPVKSSKEAPCRYPLPSVFRNREPITVNRLRLHPRVG
jgi:hypothetical protein